MRFSFGRIQNLGCKRLVCFLFSFSSICSATSQSMRILSTRDGLPQSFVSGLVQDDSSFVWIGTRNGLVRFDGIQYKIFQHNPDDTASIASNLIIWLRRDARNHIWIEHESGVIAMLDPVTEQVKHLFTGNTGPGSMRFIRRGWLVDEDSLFWGIPQGAGLMSYDLRTKKIDIFNRGNAGWLSDTVRGIGVRGKDEIWILGKGMLSVYNKQTKQFSHWPIPFHEDYGDFPNSDGIALDLHARRNGEWMWGDRRSLFFFNPSTQSFRMVSVPMVAYMGIRWIRTAPDGTDYIENYGSVYSYDDKQGLKPVATTLEENVGDIKSFLVDRSGLIWIGTNGNGIKQFDLGTPYFKSKKYQKDFISDVLSTGFGAAMLPLFHWIPAQDNLMSSPSYQLRSVYDARHHLYISLKNTVCYFDSSLHQLVRLPPTPAPERIIGMDFLGDDTLLIVSVNGEVMNYNAAAKRWDYFMAPGSLKKATGSSFFPIDLSADRQAIWISSTTDGLVRISLPSREIMPFKKSPGKSGLPANELLALRTDPIMPDFLWIGSFEGLIRLNKKDLSIQTFSMKDGLPDNMIYALEADSKGNLWLTTNKGLCRFDPLTHHIRLFKTQHGLPGDEFNRFHQLVYPDGRLIFGGTEGWTIFDPLMVKTDGFDPAIALTEIRINNKETNITRSGLLRLPINAVGELTLPYDQNTVSIGFAGLEYSQPQELLYRYKLEGYDKDWVYAGNSHQANYTKIPPGSYHFLVNASNTSGKWSSQIKSLSLRISHPWWSTTMAYICYSIILAGLIWTFIRFRVSRSIMKQEMILKEKETTQLKELDDMKSRFFSNITHEFRTPLTLIMAPAEQLKTANADLPQQREWSNAILYNANQLLNLVNRLMDLSKLEAKALNMVEQRGNPGSAAGSVVHSFEMNAKTRGIHLSFRDDTGHMDCWFFADALERIVFNLVSNALKFTEPGGQVLVSLDARDGMLELTVRDTGIGIPEENIPRIFDRYYQVSENPALDRDHWDRGTGIGLAMVKELVNQMRGNIEVESHTGEQHGTHFIVTMPYRLAAGTAIAPVEEMAENGIEEQAADSPDKRPQIVLVEDNQDLAGFIISILSGQYEVKHVVNGALGLQETLSLMPDLIISDVMMPVMDGFEFCRRIKEDIRTDHIPVILLTAKVTQEDLLTGLTGGANDYITKPFHLTELLLRVRNLLAVREKIRERIKQELSVPSDTREQLLQKLPPVQDIFLTRLYALLDEHLDDSLFGVDQIADLVHMSRSSLHRKLKSLTGLSTTEVVRNYRLSKATEFLREGYNSSDTAYKSGFGSPAYFTKSFREVYGITPTEYVRRVKV